MEKYLKSKIAICTFLLLCLLSTIKAQQSNLHEMSKAAGLAETSRIDEAEKLLTPILNDNPNWGEGWIYLGRSLAKQEKFIAAAKAFEKAGNLGERKATIWLEACSAAQNSKADSLALNYFQKALAGSVHRKWLIQDSSFDGYLDLEDFLDTPVAQELLLEAAFDRPSLHPTIINIEKQLFKNDHGITALDSVELITLKDKYVQTLDAIEKDGELHFLAGIFYSSDGNRTKAIEAFQNAKRLDYLPSVCDGWIAYHYTYLGEEDSAFIHLERNLTAHDAPDWAFYPGEFDSLHSDPRWNLLKERYSVANSPMVPIPVIGKNDAPYPAKEWPSTDPSEVGMDENILKLATKSITSTLPSVTSLLVVKDGYLVYENYFNGYTEKDAFNIKSCTKSILGTLAGIMSDKNLLPALDKPLVEIPSAKLFQNIEHRLKRKITLQHLLTMTAGLEYKENNQEALDLFLSGNYAKLGLEKTQLHSPGDVFQYSSIVSHILGVTLADIIGQDLLTFSKEHLFDPLEIEPEFWMTDLNGYYTGDSELRLTSRDFAKFGLLILRGGKWQEKQLVSKEWLQKATSPIVPVANGPQSAYGYQFWIQNIRGHRAIVAKGYGGQRCWIVPSLDLVCVVTSEPITPDNDPDVIIGEWIIPAVENFNDK